LVIENRKLVIEEETKGWLKFVVLSDLLPARRVQVLVEECEQLCRILGKSVATAKGNEKCSRVFSPAAEDKAPDYK
jgi:hypothetical protein